LILTRLAFELSLCSYAVTMLVCHYFVFRC